MADIAPGQQIHVKVVKTPTNAAARKTLQRLLARDADAKRTHRRLEKARADNMRSKQRGGRDWKVRLVKQHPVQAAPGESGTLLATLDTLRDLKSVERFVEISKA